MLCCLSGSFLFAYHTNLMSDDLTIELGARDVNLEGFVNLENIHRCSLSTLVENFCYYFSLSCSNHVPKDRTSNEIFYTHDFR